MCRNTYLVWLAACFFSVVRMPATVATIVITTTTASVTVITISQDDRLRDSHARAL